MELTVTKSSNAKGQTVTSKKKCRHNNSGYCKMKAECVYYHSDKICDQYLTNGKCTESRLCLDRHPKECKFWLEDPRGCHRGEICKYLHKSGSNDKNMKNGDFDDRANAIDPMKSTHEVEKGIDNKNNGDKNNKEDMIVDTEEEASKTCIVKEGTKSANQETENKLLKEQLEQMKRVVLNMNNALKVKQG
jgi:hypothetical protein